MKRLLAAAAVLVFTIAAAAWAQQGAGPGPGGPGMGGRGHRMYDPAKAETITGQVTEVREFTMPRGDEKGVGLTVRSGDKTVDVHLGPKFYVDKQSVKIAAGDTVEITGVQAERRGRELFIAGQVKKGNEVLKLHDENGRPLWAGQGPRAGGPPSGTAGQPTPRPKAPVGC